jgi:monoterpene epsilon-lactone hydrolase
MMLRRQGLSQSGKLTIAERRAAFDDLARAYRLPPDVERERVAAGGIRAEWIAVPESSDDHAVLYLHGGGYSCGSLESHRELAARLARAACARVLLIAYRLAPEHPYPAALEDACAAYRWLREQEPAAITVAGDSAGGGLALALLVALRDAEDSLPAAAALFSPWVDYTGQAASMTANAEADPIFGPDVLAEMAANYLTGRDAAAVSPLNADLRDLPPLLLQVGTTETLYDDSRRLAERAEAAGVHVVLEENEGLLHVWHLFANLPEAAEAVGRAEAFLAAAAPALTRELAVG